MRVILTGPECTGKTTLTSYLGGRYNLPFADEYAREYLEKNGPRYDYPLLLELSRGHVFHQQSRVPPAAPVGVLDTDLTNYKIWCDIVYGKCHPEIERRMEQETTHVYLLCYPDLPWVADPLRESKDHLVALYEKHVSLLQKLGRPFNIVRGIGQARFRSAEAGFQKLTGLAAPPSGSS